MGSIILDTSSKEPIDDFGSSLIMNWSASGLAFFALQAASLSSLFGPNRAQFAVHSLIRVETVQRATYPTRSGTAPGPHCETLGTEEIKISCTYSATSRSAKQGTSEQRIVLNRVVLSFGTKRDSYMFVYLTLTNEGEKLLSEPHTVYLSIDDEGGNNMVRRILSKVDLSKLLPGPPVTFSERLLIGGFRRGRYTISLLILNPDPSLKDNPARNVLLSSEGVANSVTGYNTIARFVIAP